MKIGVISDLHGDRLSLERALDALVRLGVDRVVCAGDLVEKGPDGDGVVALLQESLIPSVMGNHDENAVRHARCAVSHAGASGHGGDEVMLSEETLRYLAELPRTLEYVWEGTRVLIAHGTPRCAQTYVYPDAFPKKFKRSLRALEADVLILGHTHQPMCVDYQARLRIINPGSVCRLRTRDSHTCGVLELPSKRFRVVDL